MRTVTLNQIVRRTTIGQPEVVRTIVIQQVQSGPSGPPGPPGDGNAETSPMVTDPLAYYVLAKA
jgi:hypothetical protein